jgi:hypothetical protein
MLRGPVIRTCAGTSSKTAPGANSCAALVPSTPVRAPGPACSQRRYSVMRGHNPTPTSPTISNVATPGIHSVQSDTVS